MRLAVLACALITALPAARASFSAENAAESHIAFANTGGIQDWRALDDKGLYIQGPHRQWYYATLFASCFGLSTSNSIGFVAGADGAFDKFSSIVVENSRCPVTSLVKSEPPQKKEAAKKK